MVQETQLNLKNPLNAIAEPFISKARLSPEQGSGHMVKADGFCSVSVCEYMCVQMRSVIVDQKSMLFAFPHHSLLSFWRSNLSLNYPARGAPLDGLASKPQGSILLPPSPQPASGLG